MQVTLAVRLAAEQVLSALAQVHQVQHLVHFSFLLYVGVVLTSIILRILQEAPAAPFLTDELAVENVSLVWAQAFPFDVTEAVFGGDGCY